MQGARRLSAEGKPPDSSFPDAFPNMPYPLVYELNTRCWLNALSAQSGRKVTLATVPPDEVENWRRLGFTHIWLMGVWTSGPRARRQALEDKGLLERYAEVLPGWREADVAGSPYAIAEYSVAPELGGPEGLERFRSALHQAGLKLLLDFVPNHLGLDHPWLRERPGLFVHLPSNALEGFRQETDQGVHWLAHGKDPYFPGWSDTAQLEYRSRETRLAMTELLQRIASQCDGVRCDMAMLLLNEVFAKTWASVPAPGPVPQEEFWSAAIGTIKQTRPDFLFMAEAYWGTESRLQDLGFDYTYDKGLYDLLVAHDTAGVQQRLLEMPVKRLAASAHFLENHDEPRIASLLSFPEHRAAALLMVSLPGLTLLHEGQLSGALRQVPVQLVRRPIEQPNQEIKQWYEKLLTVLPLSAVKKGRPTLLKPRPAWADNATARNFVLLSSELGQDRFDLVVINLSNVQSQCYAPLDARSVAGHAWSLHDLLGVEHYERSGEELQRSGLYLDVPPHAAQLFHFEPQT